MAAGATSDRTASRAYAFERAIEALRADIAAAGAHMVIDAQARATYDRLISRLAAEMRADVQQGRLTWEAAAERARGLRNATMEIIRSRSTPVGRAFAEQLKREGLTLNELIARKTVRLFGERADFNRLDVSQRNQVFAEIVDSAGRSNPRVTGMMRGISRAGRALLVVSVAVAVYNIGTDPDHWAAARREGAILGGGIAGGAAGGALAGLACGPGAPVCVTIGAFVGGTAAALGVGLLF
ncbi:MULTISPECIES: hypothetical protein [Methylobacterium]|uniref:hypothetical protein n=1 Tax=Methylobacterium TaxID=407 RepID=UPI00104F0D87|nr:MULTISPECIES: hypothetical protein [Methylobacterium]MDR7035620.1 hypothetical protein [Methylobacterium sp. BE186]